jgi:hypothetical protein
MSNYNKPISRFLDKAVIQHTYKMHAGDVASKLVRNKKLSKEALPEAQVILNNSAAGDLYGRDYDGHMKYWGGYIYDDKQMTMFDLKPSDGISKVTKPYLYLGGIRDGVGKLLDTGSAGLQSLQLLHKELPLLNRFLSAVVLAGLGINARNQGATFQAAAYLIEKRLANATKKVADKLDRR